MPLGCERNATTLMDSQQGRQHDVYGQYEGVAQNDAYTESYATGQKLDNEDEQFADILVRRIKQELGDDAAKNAQPLLRARMIVAITSLCVLVLLFALLVLVLLVGQVSSGGDIALGYSFFFCVVAIIVVNSYFNKLSSTLRKQENIKKTR